MRKNVLVPLAKEGKSSRFEICPENYVRKTCLQGKEFYYRLGLYQRLTDLREGKFPTPAPFSLCLYLRGGGNIKRLTVQVTQPRATGSPKD